MSQIANITVFDGAATPVSHTLVPVSVTREGKKVTAYWREQIASLPVEAQVSLTLTLETLKSGVVRCEAVVDVPIMETVTNQNAAGYTAAPKKAYSDREVWTGFAHPRSTITGRRLARQILVNIGNNVSTSVAAATGGPFAELIDQLVAPT
jgi:hypothetical protein